MDSRVTVFGWIVCVANVMMWSLAIAPAAEKEPAVKRVDFGGQWDGKYVPDNRKEPPGAGKYDFGKEKAGRWDITVTWIEDGVTKSMPVKGERLGPDALRLEGKYKDTTYWYIGRWDGKALVLRYLSVDAKGKSGTGVSTLTRPPSR